MALVLASCTAQFPTTGGTGQPTGSSPNLMNLMMYRMMDMNMLPAMFMSGMFGGGGMGGNGGGFGSGLGGLFPLMMMNSW